MHSIYASLIAFDDVNHYVVLWTFSKQKRLPDLVISDQLSHGFKNVTNVFKLFKAIRAVILTKFTKAVFKFPFKRFNNLWMHIVCVVRVQSVLLILFADSGMQIKQK